MPQDARSGWVHVKYVGNQDHLQDDAGQMASGTEPIRAFNPSVIFMTSQPCQTARSSPMVKGQRTAAEHRADGEGGPRFGDRRDRQDLVEQHLLIAGEVWHGGL